MAVCYYIEYIGFFTKQNLKQIFPNSKNTLLFDTRPHPIFMFSSFLIAIFICLYKLYKYYKYEYIKLDKKYEYIKLDKKELTNKNIISCVKFYYKIKSDEIDEIDEKYKIYYEFITGCIYTVILISGIILLVFVIIKFGQIFYPILPESGDITIFISSCIFYFLFFIVIFGICRDSYQVYIKIKKFFAIKYVEFDEFNV
jgi:hypothetical protein